MVKYEPHELLVFQESNDLDLEIYCTEVLKIKNYLKY